MRGRRWLITLALGVDACSAFSNLALSYFKFCKVQSAGRGLCFQSLYQVPSCSRIAQYAFPVAGDERLPTGMPQGVRVGRRPSLNKLEQRENGEEKKKEGSEVIPSMGQRPLLMKQLLREKETNEDSETADQEGREEGQAAAATSKQECNHVTTGTRTGADTMIDVELTLDHKHKEAETRILNSTSQNSARITHQTPVNPLFETQVKFQHQRCNGHPDTPRDNVLNHKFKKLRQKLIALPGPCTQEVAPKNDALISSVNRFLREFLARCR